MKFDELFDQRNLVAMNLKNCIRDRGFTKISLAKKANISRPTLDKILNGSIDNKSTFDKHLWREGVNPTPEFIPNLWLCF